MFYILLNLRKFWNESGTDCNSSTAALMTNIRLTGKLTCSYFCKIQNKHRWFIYYKLLKLRYVNIGSSLYIEGSLT